MSLMNFGIYNNKRLMERTQIENLSKYIKENIYFITGNMKTKILDKEERALYNIKKFSGIKITDEIKSIHDILSLFDKNEGICERVGCQEKKKKSYRWKLRDFCSRKCADLYFSEKQKGIGNTSHRMTQESKKNMGDKISINIKNKIANGTFTPNITNSWSHSKIKIFVNGKEKFVRSSWEAYFYILNPQLYYELIRIPYFDNKKKTYRNYITDFCDIDKKIIYEIKPSNKKDENKDKSDAAYEWSEKNNYSFIIITQDWIKNNYDKKLLDGQPNQERISMLIEKMIKYDKK